MVVQRPSGTCDPELVDFVDFDYEVAIEDESEDSLQYLGGYFHPIRLGKVLDQRYQVVHKLGRGGFSTVWLTQDDQSGKAVALKILCSSANADDESKAHIIAAEGVKDRSGLVLYLDKFVLERMDRDVKRRYPILVLPLRGPNLMTLKGTKRPLARRMSAAKHLSQAVASIHSAGLVHRGKRPNYASSYTGC